MGLLEKKHSSWMQKALHEARKAYKNDEIPVGAVIVYKDEIIGKGFNRRESLNDPTAHAEILAITSAATHLEDWRLEECRLYVTLEPCPMCVGAILNARIPKLYFGAYDEEGGMCGSNGNLCNRNLLNHTVTYRGGIMEDKCANLLKQFFDKIRED